MFLVTAEHCLWVIYTDYVDYRYPEDLESFYQTRLPGTWDAERAGKRMKLPTPETWETQVSLKGNKAAVWQQLIGKTTVGASFTALSQLYI